MNHIRHGDVLLTKVDSLPESAKEITKGQEYTVAYGEFTGHTHVLSTKTKNGIKVFEADGKKYLDLTGKARLRHQEHKELEIPPAIYRVDQERESDYFANEIVKVQD